MSLYIINLVSTVLFFLLTKSNIMSVGFVFCCLGCQKTYFVKIWWHGSSSIFLLSVYPQNAVFWLIRFYCYKSLSSLVSKKLILYTSWALYLSSLVRFSRKSFVWNVFAISIIMYKIHSLVNACVCALLFSVNCTVMSCFVRYPFHGETPWAVKVFCQWKDFFWPSLAGFENISIWTWGKWPQILIPSDSYSHSFNSG